MTVSSANLNQIWSQISKFQSQIRLVIVILLALYLLAYLAEITWRLWPVPENASVSSTSMTASGSKTSITNKGKLNLAPLKTLNLFGDLTAVAVVEQQAEVTDAPETRLNLTLTGVVATNEPSIAAAIIENRGTQNTYGIDDKIDGTNASLSQVFSDRVIIKNGPRKETLMLDGVDYNAETQVYRRGNIAVNAPAEEVFEREQHKVLSREVAQTTREMQQNPAAFTDYIRISPTNRNGQIIGYRISPGKDPDLFKAAGFIAGDIVTEINGLDLTDPAQSIEALSALRESQSLQLTINRGEELLTLFLEFPDGNEEQDI